MAQRNQVARERDLGEDGVRRRERHEGVDVAGRDVGSYVNEAKSMLREHLRLPAGYSIAWSGQYEAMERVQGYIDHMKKWV